jgi:hypothetical protein
MWTEGSGTSMHIYSKIIELVPNWVKGVT